MIDVFARTPRLEIYPDRIEENARAVLGQCRAHGVEVTCVGKVMGSHPALLQAFERAGAVMIGDSRIENLQPAAESGLRIPAMLLRIPSPSRAVDVVRWADYSLNSSVQTVEALSRAAQLVGRDHRVVLMVDVGDLREGVWPDQVLAVARKLARLPRIELVGLGTNLACFGGVVPTRRHMELLVELRDACRAETGLPLDLISGGNSANLPLMAAGQMPPEINHLRIGEAIVLGRNTLDRSPWPGTRQDTVRVVAEVVEVECKPSVPVGASAQDAFGGRAAFVDRGIRRRAICDIGRQDVVVDGLTPADPGILVLGGSSDHLVLDVEDADREVRTGSSIGFFPSYGSLLATATSAHVQKLVCRG